MSLLFEPLQVGALELPNRVIMAPLTRCRAVEGRVPDAVNALYYSQRAGAGLILSEATSVSPQGVGYPDTPGIWSDEQVEGWKIVTDAVHDAGGRIFLQLWHVGRISDPIYLNGELPVAPSAIRPAGTVSLARPKKEFETPRALEGWEIPGIVADFKKGAQNAKDAGFDGVEIHGANGYLIDQFLQSSTNKRTDDYGGNLENRARLALEIADAVVEVWGADRVGYHISPRADSHDMGDENLVETFGFLVRELSKRQIAFIFSRAGRDDEALSGGLRRQFDGIWIANQGFTKEEAEETLERDEADAISWGQQFIANPDLPLRLRENWPLNEPNPASFYIFEQREEGYTDYPALDVLQREVVSA